MFISLSETGERSFSFHRTRAAEQFLGARDVDLAFLATAKAMHCGSNSLLQPEAQRAVLEMARATRAAGRLLCCDPNLRLHLWPDPRELQRVLAELIPLCSVVKLAEEEMAFVTGESRIADALSALQGRGVALPIVTSGASGADFLWRGTQVHVPAVPARVVDTTGAGDGFVSGLLSELVRRYPSAAALEQAPIAELTAIVRFACVVGGRAVEKLGAVAGLPTREALRAHLPAEQQG